MVIRRIRGGLAAAGLMMGLGCGQVSAGEAPLSGPVEAQVLRVIDGDTVQVAARIWLSQTVETFVRVKGIDTPELRGNCPEEKDLAVRARAFVMDRLVAGQGVTLLEIEPDKYGGRVVARLLTADGQDVGEQLVAAGLAYRYDGGRKTPWCH